MKNYLFLIIAISAFTLGCNYTGKPVEFSAACNKENDDQYVEIVGYFKNTGIAMCSKSGNEPMRCPIDFIDAPGSSVIPIRGYIDKGSGKSSIDAAEGKPLVITDEKGEPVSNDQKVKIVADINVFDTPPTDAKMAACFMTVKKIEKQ